MSNSPSSAASLLSAAEKRSLLSQSRRGADQLDEKHASGPHEKTPLLTQFSASATAQPTPSPSSTFYTQQTIPSTSPSSALYVHVENRKGDKSDTDSELDDDDDDDDDDDVTDAMRNVLSRVSPTSSMSSFDRATSVAISTIQQLTTNLVHSNPSSPKTNHTHVDYSANSTIQQEFTSSASYSASSSSASASASASATSSTASSISTLTSTSASSSLPSSLPSSSSLAPLAPSSSFSSARQQPLPPSAAAAAAVVDEPPVALRVNVLTSVRDVRFSHLALFMSLLLNLPQIVAIILTSSHHWNPQACDRPIQLWAVLHAARLAMVLFVTLLPVMHSSIDTMSESYQKLSDSINLLGFAWFLVGNWLMLNTSTCQEKAPEMYSLCISLLLIQYVIMFLPCLILVCLAPLIFFCLPLLIRLSILVPGGRRAGANESVIDAIPVTIFRANNENNATSNTNQTNTVTSTSNVASQGNSFSFSEGHKECAICLSDYIDGDEIRQLPCHSRHHFHKSCIDNWLRLHNSCPCCRQSIGSSSSSSGIHSAYPQRDRMEQMV